MDEVWKPVVGYEGRYEVSNFGKVRSLDTFVVYSNGRSRVHKGRVLKQETNHGYKRVVLVDVDKEKSHKRVHRLVAEAFIPNTNSKPYINHIDHNKQNNCIENLEWAHHKKIQII